MNMAFDLVVLVRGISLGVLYIGNRVWSWIFRVCGISWKLCCCSSDSPAPGKNHIDQYTILSLLYMIWLCNTYTLHGSVVNRFKSRGRKIHLQVLP